MNFEGKYTILVEANHLFKAGAHHQRKIKIQDVIAFIEESAAKPADSVRVLYGTYDIRRPNAFLKAVRIAGYTHVQVPSIEDANLGKFFDVSRILEEELSRLIDGENVLLVGFHHLKFLPAVKRHFNRLRIHIAAFTTASNAGGFLSVPREMYPYMKQRLQLDLNGESIIGIPGICE